MRNIFLLVLFAALVFATPAHAAVTYDTLADLIAGVPSPDPGYLAWILDGDGPTTPGEDCSGSGTPGDGNHMCAWDGSAWVFVQEGAPVAPPGADPETFLDAFQVRFDPAISGLSAVQVQDALDEIQASAGGPIWTVVGSLPGAPSNPTQTYVVIDGNALDDCAVGAGDINVHCSWDGLEWQALGGGAGGDVGASAENSFTGILTGGEVTINGDTTKFDVAAGTGIVVDWTTPGTPVLTEVSWGAMTAVTPAGLATDLFTNLAINASGVLVQRAGGGTGPAERRQEIILQSVIHSNLTIIDDVAGDSTPAYEVSKAIIDYINALGPVNVGNSFGANGANLNVNKSAGVTTLPFINRGNDTQNPSNKTDDPQTPATLFLSYRDGSGGFTVVPSVSVVDPNFYDDGSGTLVAVANNKWQVQRFHFISQNQSVLLEYGQETYTARTDALNAVQAETFAENPFAASGTFTTALIVQEGATDLNDSATAEFVAITHAFSSGVFSPNISPLIDHASFDAEVDALILASKHVANVMDFGAVGDGAADDKQAFYDAYASLPADGGTIFVPCGNYKIFTTNSKNGFNISTSNVGLLGEGECSSLETSFDRFPGPFVRICSNPTEGCCIDLFDGGNVPQDGGGGTDGFCDDDGSTVTSYSRLQHNFVRNLKISDPIGASCWNYDPDTEDCPEEESHGIAFYGTDYSIVENVYCYQIGDECIGFNKLSSHFVAKDIYGDYTPYIPTGGGTIVSVSNSDGPGLIDGLVARNIIAAPNGTCTGSCPNIGSAIHIETVGADVSVGNIVIRDVDIISDGYYGIVMSSSATVSGNIHDVFVDGGRIITDSGDAVAAIGITGTSGHDNIHMSNLYIEGQIAMQGGGKTHFSITDTELIELIGDDDPAESNSRAIYSGVLGLTITNVTIRGFEGAGLYFDGNAGDMDIDGLLLDENAWGGGDVSIGSAVALRGTNTFKNVTIYGKPVADVCTGFRTPAKCCTGVDLGCDSRPDGTQYNHASPLTTESKSGMSFVTTSNAQIFNALLYDIPQHAITGLGIGLVQDSTIDGYGYKSGGAYHAINVSQDGVRVLRNTIRGNAVALGAFTCIALDIGEDMHAIGNITWDCGNPQHIGGTGVNTVCMQNISMRDGAGVNIDCDTETQNVEMDYSSTAVFTISPSELDTMLMSEWFGAERIEPDGTNCLAATSVALVTNGPTALTIACSDNDSATIQGTMSFPDGWDASTTLTFTLVLGQIAASTDLYVMHFEAQCVTNAEVFTAFVGTGEVIALISLSADDKMLETTSAAVTLNGTSCAGGDVIAWQGAVDAALSGTNIATEAVIIGVKVEYAWDPDDS